MFIVTGTMRNDKVDMDKEITTVDRILKRRWLSHLLFWCGSLSIFTLLAALNSGSFKNPFINYLALLPAQMMAAYTLVYFQVPRLLYQRKYFLFALTSLLFSYVFAVLARLSIVYFAEPLMRDDFEQESILEILSDPGYLYAVYIPAVYLIPFLMLAFKAIKERFDEKHLLEVLQKEKVTTELKFLKAQMHPHFLFNTLNNLYALTLAKSDTAPIVVLKLSEMLDYILYQCNAARVNIHQEIELLENYIELESLRYSENLTWSFEHEVSEKSVQIAPLILLPLVENAFKHGAVGQSKALIKIELKVAELQLHFEVFNSTTLSTEIGSDGKEGIGLTNVKRQLALNYPNNHKLEIERTNQSHKVTLDIELSISYAH